MNGRSTLGHGIITICPPPELVMELEVVRREWAERQKASSKWRHVDFLRDSKGLIIVFYQRRAVRGGRKIEITRNREAEWKAWRRKQKRAVRKRWKKSGALYVLRAKRSKAFADMAKMWGILTLILIVAGGRGVILTITSSTCILLLMLSLYYDYRNYRAKMKI